MSSWFPDVDVPTLPVVDLITGRVDSSDDDVTSKDLDDSQIRWDFVKLYRLSLDRRKELCALLVRLTKKKAPDLQDSDAYKTWSKVEKDPSWPDRIMSDRDADADDEDE